MRDKSSQIRISHVCRMKKKVRMCNSFFSMEESAVRTSVSLCKTDATKGRNIMWYMSAQKCHHSPFATISFTGFNFCAYCSKFKNWEMSQDYPSTLPQYSQLETSLVEGTDWFDLRVSVHLKSTRSLSQSLIIFMMSRCKHYFIVCSNSGIVFSTSSWLLGSSKVCSAGPTKYDTRLLK